MTWRNIRLILHREIRDQLRDRRTLFMVVVLPLLSTDAQPPVPYRRTRSLLATLRLLPLPSVL